MAKPKPFIKWVGGKTQLIEQIEAQLTANFDTWQDVTYIEPFVGGGAVLFYMLQNHPNITRAVINDINPDLTNCYTVIKNQPEKLIVALQKIQKEYYKLADYDKQKDYFMAKRDRFNTKKAKAVENAALFIFLNRTCFNGLYRVNKSGEFNVPFGRYNNPTICDADTILADSELLQNVVILTGDFTQTLPYADGNTFFYFDPPYKPINETSSFNTYVKEPFDDAEQIRLSNFIKQVSEGGSQFILSNSDVKNANPQNNFFDDLYADYTIYRVFAARMVNSNPTKRGKLTELMITNIQPQYSNELYTA